jgi:hypothetical protein
VTYAASVKAPEFLRFEGLELVALLNFCRDPISTHLYVLIVTHSDFKSGAFLGSYGRLMELCTPPYMERGAGRGRRRKQPTIDVVRRALDDLVKAGLVTRATTNESQGQLRLTVAPRLSRPEPKPGAAATPRAQPGATDQTARKAAKEAWARAKLQAGQFVADAQALAIKKHEKPGL